MAKWSREGLPAFESSNPGPLWRVVSYLLVVSLDYTRQVGEGQGREGPGGITVAYSSHTQVFSGFGLGGESRGSGYRLWPRSDCGEKSPLELVSKGL